MFVGSAVVLCWKDFAVKYVFNFLYKSFLNIFTFLLYVVYGSMKFKCYKTIH